MLEKPAESNEPVPAESEPPEVPAAEGTSEDAAPTVGEHTPDVGPGGEDFDTASVPLPGRSDSAR